MTLVGLLAATSAGASGPTVIRPLNGYVCEQLNASERQMLDPRGTGIYVLTAPQPDAPRGTLASSVVFVRQPRHVVNGYVEVLQVTNRPGWIRASQIKPMDADAACTPSLMSNGMIGAG